MSIRQTRRDWGLRVGRGPRVTATEFIAKVRRLMARRMVADGVVERKPVEPKFEWQFQLTLPQTYADIVNARSNVVRGTVPADTKSEARAAIKRVLNLDRLPPGTIITKVENEDSTASAGAA